MSVRIYVDAYSGYRANERPIRFWLDTAIGENELTGVYEIEIVEDRWYDPNAEYFKVRTTQGKRYILRYNEREGSWTLQSGFDGAELLARPGIEVVALEPSAIRRAESKIAGCERCQEDEADHPFDFILADVLGKHGAFAVHTERARALSELQAQLTENALVEPQGRIEVKVNQ